MSGLAGLKSGIRTEVKAALKTISAEELEARSSIIFRRLLGLPSFSTSKVICCYLSMPSGEVKTGPIITECLQSKKRLFVPKVTGKSSSDLRMFEVESDAQLLGFPKSSWGIPEPPNDVVMASPDGADLGIIDFIIVPGVAFDSKLNRLGHGKGYYDCFLARLLAKNIAVNGPKPTLVGICFDEQVVSNVPHEAHDVPLDFLVTPSKLYQREV